MRNCVKKIKELPGEITTTLFFTSNHDVTCNKFPNHFANGNDQPTYY